ncbi:MAG: hypothetical protein E7359_04250 [Clostridiales bacterium]|nr:hypothetical protein [Clostridiales bacterium]
MAKKKKLSFIYRDNWSTNFAGDRYISDSTCALEDQEGKCYAIRAYGKGEEKNGIYALAGIIKDDGKYTVGVNYYNENGEKINKTKLDEGYPFDENGFAIVGIHDEDDYSKRPKYTLMTKKGNLISQVYKYFVPKNIRLKTVEDLVLGLQDCGAAALRYADVNLLTKIDENGNYYLDIFEAAVKEYIKNLDYSNKPQWQWRSIIKKELDLFKKILVKELNLGEFLAEKEKFEKEKAKAAKQIKKVNEIVETM